MWDYKRGNMNITDELVRVEVSKMLSEKIGEYINKIISDFNKEKYGIEIEEIKIQNVHYVISIRN